tara:strand:- start:4057 stop:6552 length:2496 start_codon:yes stop_codon:yes gene_type:complete
MAIAKNPNEPIMNDEPMIDPTEDDLESPMSTLEFDEYGNVVIDLEGNEESEIPDFDPKSTDGFYENLVDKMDEEDLQEISTNVINAYESDKSSREEWEQMFDKGFDLLGLKIEETSEPFEGACTAVHPLLIESAVKFQSKAIQELLPASGPVKTKVIGKQTEGKLNQANRIKNHMNYQITDEMPEYFDEQERMLFHLPLFGSAFKKVYHDVGLGVNVSEFVPINQFYISNFATSLQKAARYTQVIYRSPIEMEREVVSGMYRDIDLGEASEPNLAGMAIKMNEVMGVSPQAEYDPQFTLLEQHTYLDIEVDEDDTELTLPYIVTLDLDSGTILSIRRNYNADDPRRIKKDFFVHYKFVPGFGFYGLGLMHFLGNLTMTATSALRALVDAGQFATLPAGFKAKGVRITGDNDPIAPGEFKEVEATGMDLTKSIVPLPYKEPSQTLFQMLQFVSGIGEKFADSTEKVISDGNNNGPVGTTMALLEASGKFFSSVHKRLHKAQKEELKILARLNYEFLDDEYPYELNDYDNKALKSDYDGKIDVIPVSDPNVPSNAHRMMMNQMAMQMAQTSPAGMFDMEELNKTILQSANMPNLDRIMPKKPDAQPLDPVSDLMAAVKGMPIKAFAGQEHDAHIQVKMAYLQDPANGGSPIMQRIVPLITANIQEHSIMKYQEQMNGVTKELTKGADGQDPKVLQMAMTQAASQVMEANKAAADKGPSSPEEQMVKLEEQRLIIDDKRVEGTLAKELSESQIANRKIDLDEKELALKAYEKGATALTQIEEKTKDRSLSLQKEAIKAMTDLIKQDKSFTQEERMKVGDVIGKLLVDDNKTKKS